MHRMDGGHWAAVSLLSILFLLSLATAAGPVVEPFGTTFALDSGGSEPEKTSRLVAGTPHVPIVIDGDANFSDTASVEGWSGDGSLANPYIIEGLDIDLGGMAGHCINISNTRVNFTIGNCHLTGASVNPGAGICLENVTYGRLQDNTLDHNYFNIYLTNSHSVLIKNNTCPDSVYSISLRDSSSYNIIADNDCSHNSNRGINLESGSHNNTAINNTCNENTFGIVLYQVSSNSVVNNTFISNSEDGIQVNNGDFNTFRDNTCGNSFKGFNFLGGSDFNTIANNTCNSNIGYGIYIDVSSNNTVVDNTCGSNTYGIHLTSSDSSVVGNNTCDGNNGGILFISADLNVVINNTCDSNSYGIYLSLSLSNLVVNNTCSGSTSHGIYLDGSEYNDIQWNAIVDSSTSGADLYGIDNVFNYNYWSDYAGNDANGDGIGDTSYSGPGFGDSHPLMYLPTPPRWTQPPSDQTVEFAFSFFQCVLNLECPSPVVWHVNNTMFFVDGQGMITTRTILPIGTYALSVVVTSIYGSMLLTSFRVTVLDTTSPGWLIIPTDQILECGDGLDYQVAVIDLSGIEHWELSDKVHFTLTASDYSVGSTARITNATALEPGMHHLQITAYDPYDNFCTATIVVRVLEETGTTTTTTTATITITDSDAIDPTMMFVIGTGVGGGAVIVIVLAVLRRRANE